MAVFDVNDHLVVVGNMGRYQYLNLFLSGMLVCLFGAQLFVSVFTHFTPEFSCNNADEWKNSSIQTKLNGTDSCASTANQTDGSVTSEELCEMFVYDKSIFTSTIVTQFDLVCEKSIYVTMVNIAWMISEGVGAVIGSYVSDRFGRKPLIIATYLVIGLFGTIGAFSVNFVMYIVMKCTMAFICFAGFSASVALAMEAMSPDKRPHAINIVDIFWVVGSSSLSLWAFLIRDWRYLQLAISLPAIPLGIACIWLLDESPHWLMSKGRKQEAFDILNKMARWNRVVAPNLTREANGLLSKEKDICEVTEQEEEIKEGCCDLWRYPRVIVRFFVFSAAWISCAFTYYALSFGVAQLPGSLFLNHFIMSAVEGLAYVACFSIAWLGRKGPTVGTFLGGALSLLISIILLLTAPEASMAVTVLSVIGKFFISASWQVVLVWQTEVYPTTLRCTLSALSGVVGRIGMVTAPYMVDLHKFIDVPHEDIILPSIYVALMVIVGLLHLIPPETNHKKVPELLRDANMISFPEANYNSDESEVTESIEDDKLLGETAMDT